MIKIKSLVKYSIISAFSFVLLFIMGAVKDSPYKMGGKTASADVAPSTSSCVSCVSCDGPVGGGNDST